MKRAVTYVKLHGSEAFIPGIGGLGSTLPSPSKSLDLKMYTDSRDSGIVFVEIRQPGRNAPIYAGIPTANCQVVLFGEPPAPEPVVITQKDKHLAVAA